MQWLALLTLSMLIATGWSAAGLPAALLLGPMIAGIVCGVNGLQLTVPRRPYLGAQAIVGAMVAGAITPAILNAFLHGLACVSALPGRSLRRHGCALPQRLQ